MRLILKSKLSIKKFDFCFTRTRLAFEAKCIGSFSWNFPKLCPQDSKGVLEKKSDKDFKKISPICGSLSSKSQSTKVWAILSWNYNQRRPFFLSNWCGNLTSNFDTLYKAVWYACLYVLKRHWHTFSIEILFIPIHTYVRQSSGY